jgi:TonB family protein
MPTLRACSAFFLFLLSSMSLAQAPDSGSPYRVGGNVTRPEKIAGDPPQYTVEARMAGVQGVVILEAVIDEQGDVTEVRVLKGQPSGLDQSAVDAVRTWKFRPATLDGKPVPVYYTLTVNFTIEKSKFLQAQDVFWGFATKDSQLATLMKEGRREEALTYVQGLPDSPEVHFARAFLLIGMLRPREAFEEAQGARDGEREMLYHLLSLAAMRDKTVESVDVALQAATAALEADPDSREALLNKSRLLRKKAGLLNYGPERQALLDEAEQLEEWAAPPK